MQLSGVFGPNSIPTIRGLRGRNLLINSQLKGFSRVSLHILSLLQDSSFLYVNSHGSPGTSSVGLELPDLPTSASTIQLKSTSKTYKMDCFTSVDSIYGHYL